MELTQSADWLQKRFIGYVLNAEFSAENKQVLESFIQEIRTTFGDAVFGMPADSLHITLMDWIAPLMDYRGQNKDHLFTAVRPEYDKVFSEIVAATKPITIHFTELRVSPGTILIVGTDNGEFQKIRETFVKNVTLLPNTKLPPQIVHSSLIRFTKAIDLKAVESFVAQKSIDIVQDVTEFRLINTRKEPLLEFNVLKRYSLSNR